MVFVVEGHRDEFESTHNPFLYGWMNDNFQKEFRMLLPCLFTMFRGVSGRRGAGIETATRADATVSQLQAAPRTEAIKLHPLRSERNGCRNDEEKVLVVATMDNVHHHNDDDDSNADD